MPMLVIGLIGWWCAHLWKRVAPASRLRFGDRGKGIVAAVLILSILLMIFGYRTATGPVWWGPSAATKGINNLLVLVAVYLFAASGMKSWLGLRMHHPQLTGVSLWAVGHLLVRGDLPGIILFGGLLLWALVEMAVISRADPGWTPTRQAASVRKEVTTLVAAVVVYVIIGLIHGRVGPNPWGA